MLCSRTRTPRGHGSSVPAGRTVRPAIIAVRSYVDKRNRRDQKTFVCLWCGHRMHADLNAAANIEARRARPNGWLFQGKAAVLAELVREFGERRVRALRLGRTGSRGAPADPRLTNPYFGGTPLAVVRSSERREAFVKSPKTQALVAA
jgi:putative transposase